MTIFTVTVHATELTRLKAEADAAWAAARVVWAAYAAGDAVADAVADAAWAARVAEAAWESAGGEK